MLTRASVAAEIERAIFERDVSSLKWFAQGALTSDERWESGSEDVLGEVFHALAEWGEPGWPLTEDDVWELGQTLKTVRDPEEAGDTVRMLFEEPRFQERRGLPRGRG